jgi:2',3'-cyclic-nucleotide 2'-phosphodiesterase/3'-nucleotidase
LPIKPQNEIEESRMRLRILTTGDLHAHLNTHDYYGTSPDQMRGLTRVASLIKEARRETPNTLLFDNGDLLQGDVIGDVIARAWQNRAASQPPSPEDSQAWPAGRPNPVMAAFNALEYDAATLGNHDFNFGLPYLHDVLAGANHPVVTANLVVELGSTPLHDTHLLPPYVILNRDLLDSHGNTHPLKIGVIGVLPPQTVAWDHKHLAGKVVARGVTETVRAFLPQMREDGADLIVVLAHTGFVEDAAGDSPYAEQAALALAQIEGIDLLVAGHTHHAFPSHDLPRHDDIDPLRGTVAGTPTVMAGLYGSHLGVADFDLVRACGRWQVAAARTQAWPVSERGPDRQTRALVADDPAIGAIIAPAHAATLAHLAQIVGSTAQGLHSYFSFLRADPCLQIVADAQSRHIRQVLAGTEHEGLPILSAVAPFRIGGRSGPEAFIDIPAGPLTVADVANLYLYPNFCCAMRVTGAQIAEWLELSAGVFRQIAPGQRDQLLIDETQPSYNFDVIYGLTYEIDLTSAARYHTGGRLAAPLSRRIRNIRLDGKPLLAEQPLIIATNDYRASGAFAVAGATRDAAVYSSTLDSRELLRELLSESRPFAPPALPVWRFAPMPVQTGAVLRTGPRARDHLIEIAEFSPTPLGIDDDGFLRLGLTL